MQDKILFYVELEIDGEDKLKKKNLVVEGNLVKPREIWELNQENEITTEEKWKCKAKYDLAWSWSIA